MRRHSSLISIASIATILLAAPVTGVAHASETINDAPDPLSGAAVYTATSSDTSDGHGHHTLEIFGQPVYRHNADGWHPASGQLTAADMHVSAEQMMRPVHFGQRHTLLTMDLPVDTVTMSSAQLDLQTPVIDGDTVTYRDAAPFTDARYTTSPSAVKESLVLRSASAPSSFRFHLADPGHHLGAATQAADGSISFSGQIDDGLTLRIPAPAAWHGDGAPPEDYSPAHATQTVDGAGDGFDLTIAVDPTWLAAQDFPVTLDPTLQTVGLHAVTGGTYVTDPGVCAGQGDAVPPNNDCPVWFTAHSYQIGNWGLHRRGYLNFDLSGVPANSSITAAKLRLVSHAWLVSKANLSNVPKLALEPLQLRQITKSWDPTTTTRPELAAITAADGPVLGGGPVYDQASGAPAYSTQSTGLGAVPAGGFPFTIDMTTLVRDWITSPQTNHGVTVMYPKDNDPAPWCKSIDCVSAAFLVGPGEDFWAPYWYQGGNSYYNAAKPAFTIDYDDAVDAQVLFLHGVTQKWTDDQSDSDESFAGIRKALALRHPGYVSTFDYYQDAGDADVCAAEHAPPTPLVAVGLPYDASQNGAVCDSEGDIGQNAVQLDQKIQEMYQTNHVPVILMGYSMGGETIRSFLAYSTHADDGVATRMVDSVVLLHGVEQGSWMAEGGELVGSLPFVGSPISSVVSRLFPDPRRPAVKEFDPSGSYVRWVDTNSDQLPAIPTYNTWGDERLAVGHCVIPYKWGCTSTDYSFWGDVVLMPGTDIPTETAAGGGERFLPNGYTAANWEWAETDRILWDPVVDPVKLIADAEIARAPEMHINYTSTEDQLTVKDCKTGSDINESQEILNVVLSRMHGLTYTCDGPLPIDNPGGGYYPMPSGAGGPS